MQTSLKNAQIFLWKNPSQITRCKFSLFKRDSALISYTDANPHYSRSKIKQELLQIYTSIAINRILYFVLFNFHLHPKDSSLIKKNEDSITSKNDSIKNVSVHLMFSNYTGDKKSEVILKEICKIEWTGMNYEFVLKAKRNNPIWKASEIVYGKCICKFHKWGISKLLYESTYSRARVK